MEIGVSCCEFIPRAQDVKAERNGKKKRWAAREVALLDGRVQVSRILWRAAVVFDGIAHIDNFDAVL